MTPQKINTMDAQGHVAELANGVPQPHKPRISPVHAPLRAATQVQRDAPRISTLGIRRQVPGPQPREARGRLRVKREGVIDNDPCHLSRRPVIQPAPRCSSSTIFTSPNVTELASNPQILLRGVSRPATELT